MEQGATSQPGVTIRAKSGVILNTPRGSLPQDLPRPKQINRSDPRRLGSHLLGKDHMTPVKRKLMNPRIMTREA
ncbi:hypothetical protein LIER_16083 [Lithospermum erythrorhizon]|uniref:Uncharacterized protein n=1 Tax=Lithospermum erythrorhizon TaxID=34254 RepID=A0AAV3Q587_LITER